MIFVDLIEQLPFQVKWPDPKWSSRSRTPRPHILFWLRPSCLVSFRGEVLNRCILRVWPSYVSHIIKPEETNQLKFLLKHEGGTWAADYTIIVKWPTGSNTSYLFFRRSVGCQMARRHTMSSVPSLLFLGSNFWKDWKLAWGKRYKGTSMRFLK